MTCFNFTPPSDWVCRRRTCLCFSFYLTVSTRCCYRETFDIVGLNSVPRRSQTRRQTALHPCCYTSCAKIGASDDNTARKHRVEFSELVFQKTSVQTHLSSAHLLLVKKSFSVLNLSYCDVRLSWTWIWYSDSGDSENYQYIEISQYFNSIRHWYSPALYHFFKLTINNMQHKLTNCCCI